MSNLYDLIGRNKDYFTLLYFTYVSLPATCWPKVEPGYWNTHISATCWLRVDPGYWKYWLFFQLLAIILPPLPPAGLKWNLVTGSTGYFSSSLQLYPPSATCWSKVEPGNWKTHRSATCCPKVEHGYWNYWLFFSCLPLYPPLCHLLA